MFQRPAEPDIETEYLILGSGPAGVTLATKLAEDGRTVWVLGSPYETQLSKAGEMTEGSIPPGTIGLKLIEDMVAKMENAGAKTKTSLAMKISKTEKILVETKRQKFFTEKLIIATGAKQPRLGFPGEDKLFNKGISDCAVCDYPLYRNKVVGVLGNHKYTIRAANFLVDQTAGVHLFWLGNDKPDLKAVVKFYPCESIEAIGEEVIQEVLVHLKDGSTQTIPIQGLFVEGKPKPTTKFLLDSNIRLDADGYVEIDDNFQTNVSNIFAVGDVTGKTEGYDDIVLDAEKLYKILRH